MDLEVEPVSFRVWIVNFWPDGRIALDESFKVETDGFKWWYWGASIDKVKVIDWLYRSNVWHVEEDKEFAQLGLGLGLHARSLLALAASFTWTSYKSSASVELSVGIKASI